jgi:Spy/CpxP family protein refolding chaperone
MKKQLLIIAASLTLVAAPILVKNANAIAAKINPATAAIQAAEPLLAFSHDRGGEAMGFPLLRGLGMEMGNLMRDLNITTAQKAEFDRIKTETRQQMEAILTPEQKLAIQNSRRQGRHPHHTMRAANLTPEQRTKAEEIMQASRRKMAAVLTAEQKQLIRTRVVAKLDEWLK